MKPLASASVSADPAAQTGRPSAFLGRLGRIVSLARTRPGSAAFAWMLAGAVVFSGCNVGLPSATLDDVNGAAIDGAPSLEAGSDSPPTAVALGDDAGASDVPPPSAPVYVPGSSPLCRVVANSLGCDPDTFACVFDADAGADSGTCTHGPVCNPVDGGPPVLEAACRVVTGSSSVVGSSAPRPSCSTAYEGGVQQDAPCTTSSDCDIGFECAGGTVGANTGMCKHYCCEGLCAPVTGESLFCDIEPVFHGINLVPVCTRVEPCTPFAGECGERDAGDAGDAGETCTLVNEVSKQTACVTPGLATVGENCTTEKCAKDLACISDMCRELCRLSGADSGAGQCPAGQTCIPSSLFGSYADVGLCSAAAPP
jgi:hypothetical protein